MLNKFKKVIVLTTILLLMFIPGCWSKRELDELGIVLGTAVDKGQGNSVKLTFEVARPRAMGAGTTGGGGTPEQPVLILNSEGQTVFDAVRSAINMNSRRLFFSHNQILMMGGEMAKDSIKPVVDFFERDEELRTEVPLAIASGEAGSILGQHIRLENASGVSMRESLKRAEKVGRILNVQLHDFVLKYNGKITSPVAPYVTLSQTNGLQTFRFSGMAVFKEDKMVGVLNEKETQGLLWVLNEVQDGIIVLPEKKQYKVVIEINEAASKVTANLQGERPSFDVKAEVTGTVAEVQYPIDITKPEEISKIERSLEKAILKQINAALNKAQKQYKADVFGFGEKIRVSHPEVWKKIGNRWDKVFPEVAVKVSVTAQVVHSGEKTKPSHTLD